MDPPRKRCKEQTQPVHRCGVPLHVYRETIQCIALEGCVSCAHKVCCGEPLLPNSKPNVRPELCPRSLLEGKKSPGLGTFQQSDRILTVGDGDFSFSLALVRTLGPARIHISSYESRANYQTAYPKSGPQVLGELERMHNAQVHFQVDATRLQDAFPPSEYQFDFIVFNFPCVPMGPPGKDGQMEDIHVNQQLLVEFARQAFPLLETRGGQLLISHKSKAAFKNWGITDLVTRESAFHPSKALVFDRCIFPGYINRKARDNKSFPVTDALTFVFSTQPVKEPVPDPVMDELNACSTLSQVSQVLLENPTTATVPVTDTLIRMVVEFLAM